MKMVSFAECECGQIFYAVFRFDLKAKRIVYGSPEEQFYGHHDEGHVITMLKNGQWEMV